jgi:abortive infection bacteriophage resistance protein
MSTFTKPAIDLTSQVKLLKSRGLQITNETHAETSLQNIGYYRLSGYSYPFLQTPHRERFKLGTTLDQILRVYEFDRHLRLTIADAVERIEVGIRARIINATSINWDPHWYLDASKFHPRYNHRTFIKKAENGVGIKYDRTTHNRILPKEHSETFIEHYYTNYGTPYLPPIWMTMELLTLGTLSTLYKGIGDAALKAQIADEFNVSAKVLASWLHSLAHIRNICAHHGRLWNRVFSITPLIPLRLKTIVQNANRFEGHTVVLVNLLDAMNHGNHWRQGLKDLLAEYPEIDPEAMGFTNNSLNLQFWNDE